MAWIESHTAIANHPKTFHLQRSLGGSLNEAIGVLHRFWWWCLEYCEDGQLDKYGSETIGAALGVNAKALIDSGWIDVQPRFQVHDWWDYTGHYCQSKYKQNPLKWQRIKRFYATDKRRTKQPPKERTTNKTPTLTYLPTLTNQTNNKAVRETAAPTTPQAEIVLAFKETYEAMTGQRFKIDKKHYIIAANLVRDHGKEAIIDKAKCLGLLCRDRSAWFAKDGWASFSIETLSSKWNSIIPQSVVSEQDQILNDIKKQEAMRERVNDAIGR
jgi:hypothetical protein